MGLSMDTQVNGRTNGNAIARPAATLERVRAGAPVRERVATNGSGPAGNAVTGFGRASRLWSALPRALGGKFRAHVDRMARDMIREIQRAVPDYAQPLDGAYGQAVIEAVRQAVLHCIDSIGDPSAPYDRWADFFRFVGRREFTEGRNMDCLQTAARVGGRVAWRHVSEFGQSMRIPPEMLCTIAEAIFAYVEEISALAIEGFTDAQARAAGTLERRRRRLLELILTEPAASTQAIADLAESARWKVPVRVAVVALEARDDQHDRPTPALDNEVLMDLEGEAPCLITPDPDRHLRNLEQELQGWRAAVGPAVVLAEAPASMRWARRAMGLVQRDIISNRPITWCRDHLSTLWLLSDEFLVTQLTKNSLAPLANLTAKQRTRLGETLLAWLETRGSAPEIADKLNVHPQTIRYRMHQLEGLFGAQLTDPKDRLEMEIALRAQRLLAVEIGDAKRLQGASA
ncbi:MAG: helix-turn-helix domain-containing protein [Sciscionella sp.]